MKVTTVYHVKIKDNEKNVLWKIALIGECHVMILLRVLEQCMFSSENRELIQQIIAWCGLPLKSGTTTSRFGYITVNELQGWQDTK